MDALSAINQPIPFPRDRLIAGLRASIRNIERRTSATAVPAEAAILTTGAAAIDAALPWAGLPAAGLHEVAGNASAIGFCAALLIRFAAHRPGAPILWCQRSRDLYGPGLVDFGLDPASLIVVRGRGDDDILWAMEEGLRSPGLAAVLGRVDKLSPIAARRLQLAAESHGSAGILLRPARPHAPSAAATTRWRISPAPSISSPSISPGSGTAPPWELPWDSVRWLVGLQRCRLGVSAPVSAGIQTPRSWLVKWCNETRDLSVVGEFRDRSAEPPSQRERAL